MPFDPALPPDAANVQAAMLRGQFNALAELIAGHEARLAALEAAVPLPPGKAIIVEVLGGGTATVTLHFTAARADAFDVWVKLPGEGDFVLATADVTGGEYVFDGVVGGPWFAKVVPKNAQGSGPESEEVNFSGPV